MKQRKKGNGKSTEDLQSWDFPGASVVKTLPTIAGDAAPISGQGAKILHASVTKKISHETEVIL